MKLKRVCGEESIWKVYRFLNTQAVTLVEDQIREGSRQVGFLFGFRSFGIENFEDRTFREMYWIFLIKQLCTFVGYKKGIERYRLKDIKRMWAGSGCQKLDICRRCFFRN